MALLSTAWCMVPGASYAQKSIKEQIIEAAKDKKKEAVKSIKSIIKPCRKYEGLFTLYQDTTNGVLYMLIHKDELNKEYIYFSHTVEGILDARHFRGAYRGAKIFRIKKYFNKIEFILENTGYYFDEKNPLSRAAGANINRAILASQIIVGENKNKTQFLIKVDDIFLKESMQQVKPSPNPKDKKAATRFNLGKLSKGKTKYVRIKNYPMNTNIVVEYVYENFYPVNYGRKAVTDARFVSVKIQHSLLEVPQNNFVPRFDDPRVGYFTSQVDNMTSVSATPYRDLVHRWHLEKKRKKADLSVPVEPIVWWIEKTTPNEFRDIIKEAALAWNEAFEAAGFLNAIEVKIQPDDATWDAGDIRYNVLRWTSSPNPPFGGYGPSFVNPRTGQILGADIMLEFIYMTNRFKYEKLFESVSTTGQEGEDIIPGVRGGLAYCSFGDFLHQEKLFGICALKANDLSEMENKELVKQSLYALILHELGHTFGLNHNMKASQLHSPQQINDRNLTLEIGLTGSVMDYSPVNIALDKEKQGLYYDVKPGPYDKWAILYGYSEALDDPKAEKQRLDSILSRSTNPMLAFGNDADDMRSPGSGIDPKIMIGDMSGNAITYAIDRIKLVSNIFSNLKEKYSTEGQSYHELRSAYLILTREYNVAVRVISRYIGGVYIDRAMVGQPGASKPFTPVSYEEQKRAMNALSKYAFGIDAFNFPADLYNYLQIQRRGFNHFGKNEDPRIHERILNIQKDILNHLLHPNVLKRITDSELYGNKYKLSEYMYDLAKAIFRDDKGTVVNSFRQNLQIEYVERLINIIPGTRGKKSQYDNISQSLALFHLNEVKKTLSVTAFTNTVTKAHREHILFLIEKALETK